MRKRHYNKNNKVGFTPKHLGWAVIAACVLLVVAGLMMLFLRHNEGVACLSIAAVLELYTAFRLPSPPRHP